MRGRGKGKSPTRGPGNRKLQSSEQVARDIPDARPDIILQHSVTGLWSADVVTLRRGGNMVGHCWCVWDQDAQESWTALLN